MHPGTMSANVYANKSGAEIRALCRCGEFEGPTAGVALGYTQVNLVILRAEALER